MDTKLLTNTELTARLASAQDRVRRARATEARLRRQLVVTDRKVRAQRLLTLGAALERAVDAEPRHLDALRRLVLPHVTRDTDRAALHGTVWALPETPAVATPAAESNEEA